MFSLERQDNALLARKHPLLQHRLLHGCAVLLEEEKELSPKEQKKLLKQKAKDATAAAAAATSTAKDKGDPVATVVVAAAAAETEEVAAPAKEKKPEAPPAPPAEQAPVATTTTTAVAEPTTPKEAAPPVEYSTPELTRDAAAHKEGLEDTSESDRPPYQNPLHHGNPEMSKLFREDFDSDEAFAAAMQPVPAFDVSADEQGEKSTAAPEYLHEIADEIVHLTMLEMNELINKMAHHYGFHEGMLSPDDDGSVDDFDDALGGAAAAAPVVEKTIFDIKLTGFDAASKIKVIKEVRSMAGLGLKEAKEMVEGFPKTILKDVKKEQAEEFKAKLEELGAIIEIV